MRRPSPSFAAPFLLALAPAVGAQNLHTELVATGFTQPTAVLQAPGDHLRLFVVEQPGRIKVVQDGVTTTFLDITNKVNNSGNERGLLGMAFHPNYQSNGFFYVSYTAPASRIERYNVTGGDPGVANRGSAVTILQYSQPFSNHNGGDIHFGPDGMLYIGTGDGGSGGDPGCRAQNGQQMLGKMLRIDVDGAFPYAIPADNPFVGDPTHLDEIWAKGLRNPYRFSFDRLTGDMYIGDVGQNSREEVSFQPASSTGGENYGWKVMEGFNCFSTSACAAGTPTCNSPSLTLPIHDYSLSGPPCSVIGGFVYRGCNLPQLDGTYFFADHCSNNIWSFEYDGVSLSNFTDRTADLDPGPGAINTITGFGEDLDGEIFILDRGGQVYRIVSQTPSYNDLGNGLAGTGGLVAKLDVCGPTGTGGSPTLRLRGAAPSAPSFLVVSTTQGAFPIFGGVLVPSIPTPFVYSFPTDANGDVETGFAGGGGPLSLICQHVTVDANAPEGWAFSNAIEVVKQP